MPTARSAISSRVTVQNPRPRKYASAAERQKALRERFPTLCVRVEQEQADFMKRIADEQGRTLQDVHLAFIKYAGGRGNLWLTQGLKGFAPLPRFEETPKENPMKRKPTPAQIAARERFAEMARSGAFKRKAKRNPAKKTVSQKISQLTREGYPQKQAVAIALSEERAGKVKRNPIKKYVVYTELKPGNWKQVRVTENLDIAKELAKSNAESGYPSVVEDSVGAILYTPQVKANPIILVSDKPIKTRRKSNPTGRPYTLKQLIRKDFKPGVTVYQVQYRKPGMQSFEPWSTVMDLEVAKDTARRLADGYRDLGWTWKVESIEVQSE